MSVLLSKLKEVVFSILPITIIVIILNFTIAPIEGLLMARFLLGAVLITFGLTIFLLGVDIGVTPIGNIMGSMMAKSNKVWFVVMIGFILGFFVSVAEPDLHILAGQVNDVTSGLISKSSIVVVVSIGVAVLLVLGLLRIVYNFPLYKIITGLYAIIFVLAIFTSKEFMAIAFDASGATTGALTVPFILALAIGVSKLKKDSKSSEKDSFGLVAIASVGAILSVMIMSILSNTNEITGSLSHNEIEYNSVLGPFIHEIPKLAKESFIALAPIVIIFLIYQKISFHLSKGAFRKILFGMLFTFIGLVMFLLGVNAGFMEVGNVVGQSVAMQDSKVYVVAIGFILGVVTILAEPAVYVLTHQIEEVTSGYVKRNSVMITLSIGVGAAVALSMVRIIIPQLQLWHYVLPGYIVAIAMTYFVPKLFVGIAFDSGGVASGPMTATFILAYAQGAAQAIEGADVLVDGFGMIAMVAMTPLIALQILGLVFKMKSRKGGMSENV